MFEPERARAYYSCIGSQTGDTFYSKIVFATALEGEGTPEGEAHHPLLTWSMAKLFLIDGNLCLGATKIDKKLQETIVAKVHD